jgi:4-amino-4-deoxy-L-arabinose transferase-like glycosyltransferase
MLKAQAPQSVPLSFNPWIYFFTFLISNSLLSYFKLSFETTLWVSLLGLTFPFLFGLWSYQPHKNPKVALYKLDFFKDIHPAIWIIVGTLALFLRFYKLTTLSAWPIYDEGMTGFSAMQIAQKGVNHLLYMYSNIPVFYLWVLSLFFKWWGPSLFNLWFLPAFFSTLWVPLAYFAARCYFSKSFSFFCVLLAALSFWPCFSGRFCATEVSILPLEALAFLCLGKCLKAKSNKEGDWFAGLLGLSLGLSFYAVYLHWISVTLIISSTILLIFWKRQPLRLAWFGLGLAIPLLLFFVLSLQTGGFYLHDRSILSTSTQSWIQKIQSIWETPKAIFWAASADEIFYKPIWGGLINPVLGSLFGIGILECLKNRAHSIYRWLCVSFLVFLLPGMFGSGFEFFRVIPILAVLIPLIVIGGVRLTQEFSSRWSFLILLILMIPSQVLDFNQLLVVYPHLWDSPAYWRKEVKSINFYRAYKILQLKSSEGPGLIFSDFVPGFDDQTLNLMDYDFNGVKNNNIDFEKTKWAAVIVNVNYQPFLAKRFGTGETYWLSKDLNLGDGGWMLWVIDITEKNRPSFLKWREASRSLNDYINGIYQNFTLVDDHSHSKVMDLLNQDYPLFKNDPFLESCYDEKKSDLLFRIGLIPEAAQSLNRAIQKGYPAANLFYSLGVLKLIENQNPEAQKAFQKACRSPLNFTQSVQFLTPPRK